MDRPTRKASKTNEWFTPPWLVEKVRAVFGGTIHIDPATTKANPVGATRFYTREDGGQFLPWHFDGPIPTNVFCNPPYSAEDGRTSAVYAWIEKAANEAAGKFISLKGHKSPLSRICLCLTTSERWSVPRWHALFSPDLTAETIFKKRVEYLDANGNKGRSPPYPTILFWYNVEPEMIAEHFDDAATTIAVRVVRWK